MRKLYFSPAYKFYYDEIKSPIPLKESFLHTSKISRTSVYWISQISGWFLFALINIIFISSYEDLHTVRLLAWILLFVLGIIFTHLYRRQIKKNNWLDLPIKKLILKVLAACILIGALIFGLTFSFSLIADPEIAEKLKPISVIVGTFNLSAIVLLWSLIYFSIHFFENYKKAEIESLIWEAAVKDFELKTLKSQLNPHFMFNAMNSIRALIEDDPQNAKVALTKLSNILRYSLKIERNETVPLEEELQTVADYLALETIRFEERLRYKIEADPKSLNVEVPPMMIQTLVENGIKHGVSKKTEGGILEIKTKIENAKLIIDIKNSGSIESDYFKSAKGFGISNTKQRLNLLYGESASFTISNKNSEVVAEIEIPIGGTIR